MASEMVKELVASGIHFGHRVSRWNPKMEPYIFGRRNLIHIIDIRETVKGLLRAKKFLAQVVGNGKDVLYVGTKRQARHIVTEHARQASMPFVSRRWLGGTLTNFRTIRSRLTRLDELELAEKDGSMQEYSKKAISMMTRELNKVRNNLDGIRTMDKLPGALVVIDVRKEHLAVREAHKLHIPTVCLIDTDSDPDFADIPIPGNDDSMRSIEAVLTHLTEAVEEGKRIRTAGPSSKEADAGDGRRRSRRAMVRADETPGESAAPSAGGDTDGAATASEQDEVPALGES